MLTSKQAPKVIEDQKHREVGVEVPTVWSPPPPPPLPFVSVCVGGGGGGGSQLVPPFVEKSSVKLTPVEYVFALLLPLPLHSPLFINVQKGRSTIPFHHSIPVEHSTDSIPPNHVAYDISAHIQICACSVLHCKQKSYQAQSGAWSGLIVQLHGR